MERRIGSMLTNLLDVRQDFVSHTHHTYTHTYTAHTLKPPRDARVQRREQWPWNPSGVGGSVGGEGVERPRLLICCNVLYRYERPPQHLPPTDVPLLHWHPRTLGSHPPPAAGTLTACHALFSAPAFRACQAPKKKSHIFPLQISRLEPTGQPVSAQTRESKWLQSMPFIFICEIFIFIHSVYRKIRQKTQETDCRVWKENAYEICSSSVISVLYIISYYMLIIGFVGCIMLMYSV